MEISEDNGEDKEEDENSKSGVCSESREHQGFDNDEPYLEENLPTEDQGDTNSIPDELYNQLEIEKDDYEYKSIVDHYFKG